MSSHEVASIAEALGRVRTRARRQLLACAAAWVVCLVLAWVVGAAGIDYLLRMPGWLRGGLLGAALVGVGLAVYRWLLPAWRFRPSLTEIALRVEQTPEAKAAGLAGLLASGLELAHEAPGEPVSEWMNGQVIAEAGRRAAGFRAGAALKRDLLRDSALALGATLAISAGIAAAAGADLTRIGLARVLAPWSESAWPKRTQLADVTGVTVHPLGTALPLRSLVMRTDQPEGKTRVEARYRVITEEGTGPTQRVVLTGQGLGNGTGTQSEVYERLIEPSALAGSAGPLATGQLEYWFLSEDDATRPVRVRLAAPPAVTDARATLTRPAYAAAGGDAFVSGPVDLGPGNDRRAVVAPVLAGSRVELDLTLSKPVPEPSREEIAAALPGVELGEDARTSFQGNSWHLEWTLGRTTRVPVRPLDEYGLRGSEDAAYTFDVVEDRAPSAAITVPPQDEAVLVTAVLDVAGEGRDDVGVAAVTVEGQAARRAADSLGAAPEAQGEARAVAQTRQPGVQVTARGAVTLGDYDLRPGDELWLTAVVADGYELAGVRHEPTRSAPRRLRVITEEDFVDQVRGELARVRDAAIRLDAEQAELAESIAGRGAVTDEERRRQTGLSQKLAQQADVTDHLHERAQRNRLGDEALSGVLRDAAALLRDAQAASEQAGAQGDRAAQAKDPEDDRADLSPEQAAELARSQAGVREDLAQLIEMLDRGQDNWLVRREVQRLLDQQRALQGRTQRAGQQAGGREMSELSPTERGELERIAAEQQDLARRTEESLQSLEQRAEQMKPVDATQSAAMEQAAQRGREQRVPQSMEQAAQSAAQNQTSSAQQQQQQAIDAMEQMLQDLDNAERNRDESLRRMLASLIESLDGLIRQQQDQLAALARAREAEAFDGLDDGMVRLNQNTLGVLGEAKAAFREMAGVARRVESAATAQGEAVGRLRKNPVQDEEAEASERESLRQLELARAEAQKLQEEAQQRDQDRKRQELRKVYREALELQVALRDETAPLLAGELDRRRRMTLRGMGDRQESIRVMLADLRARTAELAEAVVFDLAHERLDAATGGAAKKMRAGQATAAIGREQDSAVRLLQSLVEALAETADQGDDFQDTQGGESGGSGGGRPPPLIPDLAELRLLKGLQIQAAELTRALDEAGEAPAQGELSDLADFQRTLAERGAELLEKLERPGTPEPSVPGERP